MLNDLKLIQIAAGVQQKDIALYIGYSKYKICRLINNPNIKYSDYVKIKNAIYILGGFDDLQGT